MQISGPTAVTVFTDPVTVSSAPLRYVHVDLGLGTMSIAYANRISITPVPAALLIALQNRVKAVIEIEQGWAAGTATLT
jgi:hypothetical protein